jgi:superfamily II DNA or RNA helicase
VARALALLYWYKEWLPVQTIIPYQSGSACIVGCFAASDRILGNMETTIKKLRPYQVRLVTDVCRATEDVLVEQPTGSGKTVEIVTLVAMHLGRRFSHALISAPQEQIEQGFVKRDYQAITFPDHQGVAVPSIQVPKALIKGARESRLGSVKRVIHYLRQAGPLDHAFACTHAALNRLAPEDLPADLSGKALFIDEAHHASADCLSQIITLWRERRGQLFFFTATPYRGDGRPVRLEGMRAFRRSLAEHMAEGFAPRHLESEIVALGQPGDAITAGQFTGEEAPPSSYFEALVAAICRRWLEDGKPKAIVRVPPMKGGKSGELVASLLQALTSHGARVLDATGTGASDKDRFLTALETEKNRTHATSAFDVMVGIQRVLEGTDWPLCSAVYCVGMPGSLNTVVLFLGRAMRLKGEDYPTEQRDRARLVFFVPCAGGAALADLSLDHSRHALLTCCFLADHEVGQEWIVLREVRRGIEAALGSPTENPAAADAGNEADEPIDPEVRAEVELAMASAREQIASNGNEPSLGEVVQFTARMRPDLPEGAIHRVATEILAAQPGSTSAAVRAAIHRELATRLRIDPMVKKAMAEAFATVLNQFRDSTLRDSAVLEVVGRQVHGVTGGQIREFAQRLRDAAPRPVSIDQILTWADAHHRRTGDWPGQDLGIIYDAPDEKWANINAALRNGLRGMRGGSSLAQLLAEARGVRNHLALPPLTHAQILAWADRYHERMGQWPGAESGRIDAAVGDTWLGVNAALQKGSRGLPSGSSLAQLLAKERGVRNAKRPPPLTLQQILSWADAHHNRTGEWPKGKSGAIHGQPGETWLGVNIALHAGQRGLPGRSSLAQLLQEERGARNMRRPALLTLKQILSWADAHYERTREWPSGHGGPISDAPGDTWAAVDQALQKGRRGFSGGSSLSQLVAEHRGARNQARLAQLTIQGILAWADAHYERTGQWPRPRDGPVAGAGGEKWANIQQALQMGLRGLPIGSSLAQILTENRGVRNVRRPPVLSISQVVIWTAAHHQQTGKWPTSKSGPILDAAGETWGSINHALEKGTRGLPGGSSLARLVAEQRGARYRMDPPTLTVEDILAWADEHHKRTGQWPKSKSGLIQGSSGETWAAVDTALQRGRRGLRGGSSLGRIIRECRTYAAPR